MAKIIRRRRSQKQAGQINGRMALVGQLTLQGKDDSEIAAQLGIDEGTVKVYRSTLSKHPDCPADVRDALGVNTRMPGVPAVDAFASMAALAQKLSAKWDETSGDEAGDEAGDDTDTDA